MLNDSVFFHDLAGNFYEVNAAGQRDSDYTEEELKRMNLRDLVPEPYTAQVDDYLERVRKKGTDRGYMRAVNKQGRHMILEYNSTLIYDEKGAPAGVRGILRNMTEQYHIQRELKRSEKRYRTILETIEDGYYEVDLAGNYQFLNNAALRMLGYEWEELDGENYKKLIAKEDVQAVFETFNYVYRTGNPVKAFNWRSVCKNGTICHMETSVSLRSDDHGNPVGFQGIIRDISERIEARKKTKQLEAQLQQAQKMESIGTLAGGIAHDFNNILFPIIGYTELAMQELPDKGRPYQNLEKVLKAAERAKGLIRQILAFSRQGSDQIQEPAFVQPIIKETVKLLKNTIPASIDIRAKIGKEAGPVMLPPARIHQVIMNLCTNAYQAMEEMETGQLKVELDQVSVNEENAYRHHHLSPGAYVRIRVSDTGCGIPSGILDKIFDPYFTTKSQDKGTGLGLSVSYGIVKNAGGHIAAGSLPGKGSRFDVYLPVQEQAAQGAESIDHSGPLPRGSEHVLLVDDEQRILELVQITLESLGYRVTPRTSSVEALEAFRHQPDRFDLLLTDQAMPNMSGVELTKAVRRVRGRLPVILCTGYSEKITRQKLQSLGIDALLLKPISKTDLAVTIRRVLGRRQRPESRKNAIDGVQGKVP